MEKDYVTRGLEDAMNVLGNTFTGKIFDRQMEALIEKYKREMMQWFAKDIADTENPMQSVTQEHWYSLYLEKKRLEKHRCKMQYTLYKHVPYSAEDGLETNCTYRQDGKYMVCEASQMTDIEKQYIRDNAVVWKENQRRDISYYILRSQNKNGMYICPHCGVEQSLDALLDGCDYCKNVFDISAYEDKVVSVMRNRGRFDTREGNRAGMIGWIMLAAFGFIGIFHGIMMALFTFGLSLLLALAGGVACYFGITRAMEANKGVEQNTVWKYKLQDNNPGFSEEEFIGSLDCKLKSIHYASNMKELEAFVKCDISRYIKHYQSIVNCETAKIAYKNYTIKGDYQYLHIRRQIEVLQDKGTHLQPGSGVVAMTLAKKRRYRLKNDISIYRCNDCGATISLVEGGKCAYCGHEIDYGTYDWMIVDYKHINAL